MAIYCRVVFQADILTIFCQQRAQNAGIPHAARVHFDHSLVSGNTKKRQCFQRVPGVVALSIIGCVVNGPGEAREADVGLTGATPSNLIYLAGEPDHKVSNADFIDHLESVIRKRAQELEQARQEQEEQLIARTN